MLEYGLGRGFRAFDGINNLMPWLKYQRPPHSSLIYFKRRITSSNWRPIPIGIEGLMVGWLKLQYFTEPPTAGTFNKLKFASEPPVSNAWNKLLYDNE